MSNTPPSSSYLKSGCCGEDSESLMREGGFDAHGTTWQSRTCVDDERADWVCCLDLRTYWCWTDELMSETQRVVCEAAGAVGREGCFETGFWEWLESVGSEVGWLSYLEGLVFGSWTSVPLVHPGSRGWKTPNGVGIKWDVATGWIDLLIWSEMEELKSVRATVLRLDLANWVERWALSTSLCLKRDRELSPDGDTPRIESFKRDFEFPICGHINSKWIKLKIYLTYGKSLTQKNIRIS